MRILHIVTRRTWVGRRASCGLSPRPRRPRGTMPLSPPAPEGDWVAFRGMDERIAAFPLPDLLRAISPKREMKALHSIAALSRSWTPTLSISTPPRREPWDAWRRVFQTHIVYTMHGYDQIRVENKAMLGIDTLLRPLCGAIVAVSSRDAEGDGEGWLRRRIHTQWRARRFPRSHRRGDG